MELKDSEDGHGRCLNAEEMNKPVWDHRLAHQKPKWRMKMTDGSHHRSGERIFHPRIVSIVMKQVSRTQVYGSF